MVHVHGERDGFTSAALRGASTSASTAPCHGDELPLNIIDVAMCVLHSAPSAAWRRCRHRCPFTMGRQSSLSVDRVLRFHLPLHLHLYSLSVQERMHYMPKPHVPCCECREGYIVSELDDGVRTCHSAFRQVTGTVTTH